MSDPTHPTPATEPPRAKASRGKRVLAGAALVAAGLITGGGATYAVASQFSPVSPESASTSQPGERGGGPRGGGMGMPPGEALPDGTVLGHPPLVDDLHAYSAFLAAPEPEGSAVVVLDEQTVLLSASAPRTAALLQERGLRTVAVEIGEFEKLEGCVTCLSVRIRRA